jgi:hypothetical protein
MQPLALSPLVGGLHLMHPLGKPVVVWSVQVVHFERLDAVPTVQDWHLAGG